jgi:hypothetical protein
MIALFPYLKDPATGKATDKNRWLTRDNEQIQAVLYPTNETRCFWSNGVGPTTDNFPSSLAMDPFRWFYYDTPYDMEFLGGFVGIKQEPKDMTFRPEIGWVVREVAA